MSGVERTGGHWAGDLGTGVRRTRGPSNALKKEKRRKRERCVRQDKKIKATIALLTNNEGETRRGVPLSVRTQKIRELVQKGAGTCWVGI